MNERNHGPVKPSGSEGMRAHLWSSKLVESNTIHLTRTTEASRVPILLPLSPVLSFQKVNKLMQLVNEDAVAPLS